MEHFEFYTKEQVMLEKYREKFPELLTPVRAYTHKQILERIGITIDFGSLSQGYMNLYPQDFIVEEIDTQGIVHTIEPEESSIPKRPSLENDARTLYADLIKVGLSTMEAAQTLARSIELTEKNITYAGIKDKVAITSQQIALRDPHPEKIKIHPYSGFFLKNFYWGKGVLQKGGLQGNRFVITIRTEHTPKEDWCAAQLKKVENGFYNFYYLQRFGSPRLISHLLGKLLLQKKYKEVVEMCLCANGVQGLPLIRNLRRRAQGMFGNWEKMNELFSYLPYTFRQELLLLEHLKRNPDDYLGALRLIPDQLSLWVYAYGSYYFNLHLSHLITEQKEIPPSLPLIFNTNYHEIPTYVEALEKAGVRDLTRAVLPILGYRPGSLKSCLTKSPVTITHTKIIEKGMILAFELPAGAYATTFLSHLIEIYRGLPLPVWLDKTKYDSKALLGIGSVAKVEEVLGKYIVSIADKEKGTPLPPSLE